MGSSTNELYDAIFDVELTSEFDPFEDADEDGDMGISVIPSTYSGENPNTRASAIHINRRATPSPSPRRQKSPIASIRSQRRRAISGLLPLELNSAQSGAGELSSSPLARLYAPRTPLDDRVEGAARHLEGLLDDMRELPVQKLKEEIKEIQVRFISTEIWLRSGYLSIF